MNVNYNYYYLDWLCGVKWSCVKWCVDENADKSQHFLWLSTTIRELRFCCLLSSSVSNISFSAAVVVVSRRLRLKVTVPSLNWAIKASIPAKKKSKSEYYLYFSTREGFFLCAHG